MKNYVGNPDGLNEDLSNFLQLKNKEELDFCSLEHRIIVGRKGSGKSFTLRKFVQASMNTADRFVITHEQDPPHLDSLILFTAPINPSVRTNTWMHVWELAIILSVLSHLLYSEEYASRFQLDNREDLKKALDRNAPFFSEVECEFSVFDCVNSLLRFFGNAENLQSYIGSVQYGNLKNLANRHLKQCPTLCLYLDCLDDELRRAPSIIIDITRALFYTAIGYSRRKDNRKKVHIITTLRDIVYSTIMDGEHANRYRDIPQVVFLPWSPPLTKSFISKKIELGLAKFPAISKTKSARASSVERLLGFDEVYNDSKKCAEAVDQYIIRHTNCVPRTIVTLCNRLFMSAEENDSVTKGQFKTEVNQIAAEEARMLLRVSSAYIVSSIQDADIKYILEGQASLKQHLREHTDLSEKAIGTIADEPEVTLTDGFFKPIVQLISRVGKDVFRRSDLDSALKQFINENRDYAQADARHHFGDVYNVLWTHGLIGARRTTRDGTVGDEFFFFGRDTREARLPTNCESYVFFPGLNSICNLAVQDGPPVGAVYLVDPAR